MDRRTFVAASMRVVTVSAAVAAEEPTWRSRLLGVWSLAEAVTVRGSEVVPWFGRKPPITGNLIYTESGYMSVQIAGTMPKNVSRDEFLKLSVAERAMWLVEYYSYYGTFAVDETARTITHQITNSLTPYETATMLKRDIIIDGDLLTSLTPPRDGPAGKTFNRLIWRKIA